MSQFGTLPEVVIYTEFGVEHKALVIGSRILENHSGANDEPLLNLVIAQPKVADSCANCGNRRSAHGKPAPAHLHVCAEFVEPDPEPTTNLIELVQVISDVAHESHAFTADQLADMHKQGVTVSVAYPGGQFPGGRWRELSGGIPIPTAEPTPATETGAIEAPAEEPKALPEGDKGPETVQ